MKTGLKKFFGQNYLELVAIIVLLGGGALCLLALVGVLSILWGALGLVVLGGTMFYFALKLSREIEYKKYYKESYEIEHSTIEDEIRKSMRYHRYQEAVLNRFESVCCDLGISNEQKDYLLLLLMEEKEKVDMDLKAQGGGFI